MREIKFRAKKKTKMKKYQKWVYGNLYTDIEDCFIMYRLENGDIEFESCIKETIGQFTGLCDKNNVEIYEGDIVKFFSGLGGKETCVIYYDEWQQSLNIKNYPRGYIYDGLYNLKNKKGIEVIGNIYDNEVEE